MSRRIKLKDVCREITVGHVGPMADEYVDSGIPFLRSQNILPFRLDTCNLNYISERFHKRLKKSALSPGDVVIVRTGYPGTACMIPHRLPVANCADLVVIHPSDEIDSHYLCCIFNSAWGRSTVSGRLVGVAQLHFNIGVAKEMEITLPPIGIQRRIASILSAYDALIENNDRRINILEEMAQMIYREWFVNFRFPGHEKVKMVESELGQIPKGWSVQRLRDAASFISRGISPHYDDSADGWVINQKCIRDRRLSLGSARRQSKPVPPEKAVRKGDILINSTGVGTLGRVAQVHHQLHDFTVDSHVTILRPRQHPDYLGELAIQLERDFEAMGVGSTGQTELGRERIAGTLFICPTDALQAEFAERAAPLHQLKVCLMARNDILCTTRDLLLPKLISGEIPVEAADEAVAELAVQPA